MATSRKPPKSPKKAAPRRTQRGETRRRALVDTARAIFMERGYEGTSIEDLVARVGGSKASLYSYFGSKEGLFWEVVAAQCDRFFKDLAIPTTADEDVAGTLLAIGQRYLGIFMTPERRDLFRVVISEMRRFPALAQRFYEVGPLRGRRALGAYLQLQHEAGRLRCPNSERSASLFFELVKAQPHMRAMLGLPPFEAHESVDQHVAEAVDVFLYGCASQPRNRARR